MLYKHLNPLIISYICKIVVIIAFIAKLTDLVPRAHLTFLRGVLATGQIAQCLVFSLQQPGSRSGLLAIHPEMSIWYFPSI